MFNFKKGDILLLPTENAQGVYQFVKEKFGKIVADILSSFYGHQYMHAEVYLGNGYAIGAWTDGVKIYKIPLNILGLYHVYRCKYPIDEKMIDNSISELFNLPYGWEKLFVNTIITLLSFGNESLEKMYEEHFKLNMKDKVICSELVARIYEKQGIIIERQAEFTTPDDIAQSKYFMKVY